MDRKDNHPTPDNEPFNAQPEITYSSKLSNLSNTAHSEKEENQHGRMKYQQHGDETMGLQISPPSWSYHIQSDTLDYHLDKLIPNQPPSKQCYGSLGLRRRCTVFSLLTLKLIMWLPNEEWSKTQDFRKSLVMTKSFTMGIILTLACKSSPSSKQYESVSQPLQLCLHLDLDPSKNS